ncbi:uncharacterized protein LOC116779726 isoform X1 [Danaus plexippus]|uniref:uncharacterized protein LOC116779726 isoform X1 n=1 Tax=Danaus plexippus TaxID=13037 RepID=UPI002AAF4E11|nr:uncharacterized protein LOC116779726 isoform X1 [Danaus plexippus]
MSSMDNGECVCAEATTLGILKEVHSAYKHKLQVIDRMSGGEKLQKQVEVLQSWVEDLVDQNTLLARTVEELETEFTSKLLVERRRHSEWDKSKKICDTVNDLKMLNDSLIKENLSKEREIRKLNKELQNCEQTVLSLRNETAAETFPTLPDVPKKDAEVTADICCTQEFEYPAQCGDSEPVRERALYSGRLQQMESSGDNIRSLRQLNVSLSEEVRALQRVCGALDDQCRAMNLRARFKDDVIHEMRRQLRQAKAKLKELSESNIPKSQKAQEVCRETVSMESLVGCAPRPRHRQDERHLNCSCHSSIYDVSDDDASKPE